MAARGTVEIMIAATRGYGAYGAGHRGPLGEKVNTRWGHPGPHNRIY